MSWPAPRALPPCGTASPGHVLMTLAAFDFVLGHELAVAANMARDGSALRIKAQSARALAIRWERGNRQ